MYATSRPGILEAHNLAGSNSVHERRGPLLTQTKDRRMFYEKANDRSGYVFDFTSLEDAQHHYENGPY